MRYKCSKGRQTLLKSIHETHPNSVYLGQQFGVILLHSFQTLEHGGHMGLTQQKGIIWKACGTQTETRRETKRGKEIR